MAQRNPALRPLFPFHSRKETQVQQLLHDKKTYTIRDTEVTLDVLVRSGDKTLIIFLHGFGSTK